ncbi:hypothetical protein BJY04DRAFT_233274 [Aspergillus karnatakaensis]|uniref:uncharacterized protein n=1 Tax=Aspergillus karnatakaensis TaxID=1810916 RepID=UPI003CCD75EE
MNPFATDPEHIPPSDLYADVPLYGRYQPKPSDFSIQPEHVVDLCDESIRIHPADDGGRDVFALGSVIVKSSHLHNTSEIDYSFADANEIEAIAIARDVIRDIRVPEIYFASKIRGRHVLIQERLPGVALSLHTIKPDDERRARSHVIQDPHILSNGRINPLEGEILFSTDTDTDLGFMHNDFTQSNCIVNDDKIVGLVDWEMAGFFGWKTAGEIHRRIRTPQTEQFVNAALSEEELQDILFWNDLYD